ncbi:hypothetical protein PLEOSDRAFT_1087264 [Pleurotus ostreatus PC15]|uniref:Uncharacterized protein n=1 Tax=Pleurotus ostreatus (strain PC15) TaxID=1137138 RepID=A0A067N3Y0_PLEO1|nr:hypothetical protein PLEOSDRAFT_1087264 [Pleurotus ostreatus PC15]
MTVKEVPNINHRLPGIPSQAHNQVNLRRLPGIPTVPSRVPGQVPDRAHNQVNLPSVNRHLLGIPTVPSRVPGQVPDRARDQVNVNHHLPRIPIVLTSHLRVADQVPLTEPKTMARAPVITALTIPADLLLSIEMTREWTTLMMRMKHLRAANKVVLGHRRASETATIPGAGHQPRTNGPMPGTNTLHPPTERPIPTMVAAIVTPDTMTAPATETDLHLQTKSPIQMMNARGTDLQVKGLDNNPNPTGAGSIHAIVVEQGSILLGAGLTFATISLKWHS